MVKGVSVNRMIEREDVVDVEVGSAYYLDTEHGASLSIQYG
ncbi:hypothetical protein RSal33209_1987 [Renibacterium salmoninarum ATCC 33209]|uniref:Uncharacterized protein n=1 Tax=Renibacterium salmoninarum (strain ATCC 33209 / DSM 20767 / JCM 11484 / NBRC 15589 / NCIMB 2235) TaxID=288705 RepID=A9WSD2_RENSM|nr:hypothetical protein RSal33209_1987 [Renibacterium salmoninarum ATCC 33209]